jgi:hypothetical protein
MSLCSPSPCDVQVNRPMCCAFVCRDRERHRGPHFWLPECRSVRTPETSRAPRVGGPRTPAWSHGWAEGQPYRAPPRRRVERDCDAHWLWWPKGLIWARGDAQRVEGQSPGGKLTTGDRDPKPATRDAAAGSAQAFVEHLVCRRSRWSWLNTKWAAGGSGPKAQPPYNRLTGAASSSSGAFHELQLAKLTGLCPHN